MKRSVFEKKGLIVLAGAMALLLGALPGVGHASTIIEPGFNLFTTPGPGDAPPGTMFDFGAPFGLQDLKGMPLNTFDFTTLTADGPNAVPVGNTDTIVERLTAAGPGFGGTDTINIRLVALSLVSVNSFNFGFGLEQAKITLKADLGSTMTINGLDAVDHTADPHGTFDSTLWFSFNVRGLISDEPITMGEKTIVSTGNQWRHAPTGLTIIGINHLLNGTTSGDLFPLAPVLHDDGINKHTAVTAVPEPGTALLIGMGLVGLGMKRGRRGVVPIA